MKKLLTALFICLLMASSSALVSAQSGDKKESSSKSQKSQIDLPPDVANKIMSAMLTPEGAEEFFTNMADQVNARLAKDPKVSKEVKFTALDMAKFMDSTLKNDKNVKDKINQMPWPSSAPASNEDKLKFMKEITRIYLESQGSQGK